MVKQECPCQVIFIRCHAPKIKTFNQFKLVKKITELFKKTKGKPTAIIANTIKGKGVSFMENEVSWHGKAPNEEEYKKAINELS